MMRVRGNWFRIIIVLEDRARLGDSGIKGFDDGGVLLLDDAALELEGESEGAVVESEIFGEKSETLDGFILREMNGQTLDFDIDQSVHPGMGGQFGVGSEFDSLVGGFGGNGDGVGNDESNDEFAPVAHDQGVQNGRAGV